MYVPICTYQCMFYFSFLKLIYFLYFHQQQVSYSQMILLRDFCDRESSQFARPFRCKVISYRKMSMQKYKFFGANYSVQVGNEHSRQKSIPGFINPDEKIAITFNRGSHFPNANGQCYYFFLFYKIYILKSIVQLNISGFKRTFFLQKIIFYRILCKILNLKKI